MTVSSHGPGPTRYNRAFPVFPEKSKQNIRPENRELIDKIYTQAHEVLEVLQGGEIVHTLEYLLDNLKPRDGGFIELGSAYGGSYFCWASIIGGPAISVDKPGHHGTPNDPGTVEWRNSHWNSYFPGRPVIVDGLTHDDSSVEQVASALNGKKVDYLFIDADHGYEASKKDFELYSQFVRPGGLVGFHDIFYPAHIDECGLFWRELVGKKWESTPGEYSSGIGVYHMPL